jgi:hypothetical protein
MKQVSNEGAQAYKAESYIPPANVARAARMALEVRQSKPKSQRGMTMVGLVRANQLAQQRPVSVETLNRMVAYFDRHEVDKQGSTWIEKGKGWQAWMGWGGDAGRAWATRVLNTLKENDMSKKADMAMPDMTGMSEEEMLKVKLEHLVAMIYDIAGMEMPSMEVEDTQEDVVEDVAEEEPMPEEAKVDLTAEERDALPDNDFAVPSSRNFPINSPVAVSDAVAGWGRYEGPVSFEEFKRNLIAIAKRKGPEYVAALPQSWKDEMDAAAKAVALRLLSQMR